MTDEELLRLIAMALTDEIVRELLAGNDTCCFTTQQYEQARIDKYQKKYKIDVWDYAPEGWARRHLEMLRSLREVKPDVWARRAAP